MLVAQDARLGVGRVYHVMAALLAASVVSAALLNVEVVPGVLLDDALLLSGGLIGGLLLALRSRMTWRVHWSGLLLLAAATLATLWSCTVTDGLRPESMRAILSVWWLRIAVLGCVTVMIATKPQLISVLCRFAFYCILAIAGLAMIVLVASGEEAVLRQSGALRNVVPEELLRYSSLGSTNSIMRNVVLLLPFALWHARRGSWRLPLVLAVAGFAIALTRSRTGLIVYSIESVIALLFIARGIAPRLLTCLLLLAILPIASIQVAKRIDTINRTQEARSGARVREVLIQATLELVSERPITGWGAGNANELVNNIPAVARAKTTHTNHSHLAIHNNFMLYAIENGVATAVLAFMFFVAIIVATLVAIVRHTHNIRAWFTILALSALSSLVVMQTATVLRDNILWIALGIILTSLSGVGVPRTTLQLTPASSDGLRNTTNTRDSEP